MKSINSLPIEVMLIIFRSLDFKTLIAMKRVSKHWHELVGQRLHEHKQLMIYDTSEQIGERCGNFTLHGVKKYPKMKAIGLKNFNKINSKNTLEFIAKILQNFTNLETIYICLLNGFKYQSFILDVITNNCNPCLRHLSVIARKMVYVCESEIQSFGAKFPKLQVFQFEAKDLMIYRFGIDLLFRLLPKLEVFIVMDCIHSYERRMCIENATDGQIDDFGLYFKNITKAIRVIKVSGLLMNINEVRALVDRRLKHLYNLHICNIDSLQTLSLIGTHFKTLTSLTISNSFGLASEVEASALVESISQLSRLKKLHLFIETHGCIFTYEGLSQLAHCRQLTCLQIESTSLTSGCIEAMVRFCPQLEKLDLTYSQFPHDSDGCIKWIEHLPNLTCLKVSASPELSDNALTPILQRCQRLQYLDLSRSELLSVHTFMGCVQSSQRNPNQKMMVYFPLISKDIIQSMATSIPGNLVIKFKTVRYI